MRHDIQCALGQRGGAVMAGTWPKVIRDPVHELIPFEDHPCDRLLWDLINTQGVSAAAADQAARRLRACFSGSQPQPVCPLDRRDAYRPVVPGEDTAGVARAARSKNGRRWSWPLRSSTTSVTGRSRILSSQSPAIGMNRGRSRSSWIPRPRFTSASRATSLAESFPGRSPHFSTGAKNMTRPA